MCYCSGAAPVCVRVGDFNGDGLPDLAVLNNFSGTLSIFLGIGDGIFEPLAPVEVPALPRALAIGRFGGSGYDDIAVGNYPGGKIALLHGDGAGRFTFSGALQMDGGVTDLLALDLDNDGRLELIATTSRNAVVVCSEVNGTYEVSETYPVDGVPASLAQVDFGMEQQGVAVASYFAGAVSILLREAMGEGEYEILHHSADWNGMPDSQIDLSELLRLIQFYNAGGLHCADDLGASSEDGYMAGFDLKHACTPHDSDYNPQDWVIGLSELIRAIQFYNAGGYYACPLDGTEDGFCVGPPVS